MRGSVRELAGGRDDAFLDCKGASLHIAGPGYERKTKTEAWGADGSD